MIDKVTEELQHNGFIITYENIDQAPEEEFAKIRMSGFGASDSSKLLGVNPFPNGTVEHLIKEKVTGAWDESIGKKGSVRMGKALEPMVLQYAEDLLRNHLTGAEIDLVKPVHMYGDPSNHLNINFDGVGFITLKGETILLPVEAKVVTVFGRKYYNFNKSKYYTKDGEYVEKPREIIEFDSAKKTIPNVQSYCEMAAEHYGIPVYYYTQIQQQLIATKSDYGYLAALDVSNWDTHIFKIHKSDLVQNAIKNNAITSWTKIEVMKALSKEEEEISEEEDI